MSAPGLDPSLDPSVGTGTGGGGIDPSAGFTEDFTDDSALNQSPVPDPGLTFTNVATQTTGMAQPDRNVARRLKMIQKVAKDLPMDQALALAQSPYDDGQLPGEAAKVMGVAVVNQQAANFKALKPKDQADAWAQLTPTTQAQLKQMGVAAPVQAVAHHAGGFLHDLGHVVGDAVSGGGKVLHALGSGLRLEQHLERMGFAVDHPSDGGIDWTGFLHPDSWAKAWDATSSGEHYFVPVTVNRASDILGGDAQALDMAKRLAGGDKPEDIARQYGEWGTPGYMQQYAYLADLTANDDFKRAVQTLRAGKFSLGRQLAATFLTPTASITSNGKANHDLYNMLSGGLDAAIDWNADPAMKLGEISKTYEAFQYGLTTTADIDRATTTAENMDRAAAARKVVDPRAAGYWKALRKAALTPVERYATMVADHIRAGAWDQLREADPHAVKTFADLADYSDHLDDLGKGTDGAEGAVGGISAPSHIVGWWHDHAVMQGMLGGDYGSYLRDTVVMPHLNGLDMTKIAGKLGVVHALDFATADLSRTADIPGLLADAGIKSPGEYSVAERALNRVVKPYGDLVRHLTTLLPREGYITLEGNDTAESLDRFLSMGTTGGVRRGLFDAYFSQANTEGRLNVIGTAMDEVMRGLGVTDSDAGKEFADRWVRRLSQRYATDGIDQMVTPNGLSFSAILPEGDRAMAIAIPGYKDLLENADSARRLSFTNALFGNRMADMGDAFMGKLWKPATLLRLGFVARVAGDEALGFVLRNPLLTLPKAWAASVAGTPDDITNVLANRAGRMMTWGLNPDLSADAYNGPNAWRAHLAAMVDDGGRRFVSVPLRHIARTLVGPELTGAGAATNIGAIAVHSGEGLEGVDSLLNRSLLSLQMVRDPYARSLLAQQLVEDPAAVDAYARGFYTGFGRVASREGSLVGSAVGGDTEKAMVTLAGSHPNDDPIQLEMRAAGSDYRYYDIHRPSDLLLWHKVLLDNMDHLQGDRFARAGLAVKAGFVDHDQATRIADVVAPEGSELYNRNFLGDEGDFASGRTHNSHYAVLEARAALKDLKPDVRDALVASIGEGKPTEDLFQHLVPEDGSAPKLWQGKHPLPEDAKTELLHSLWDLSPRDRYALLGDTRKVHEVIGNDDLAGRIVTGDAGALDQGVERAIYNELVKPENSRFLDGYRRAGADRAGNTVDTPIPSGHVELYAPMLDRQDFHDVVNAVQEYGSHLVNQIDTPAQMEHAANIRRLIETAKHVTGDPEDWAALRASRGLDHVPLPLASTSLDDAKSLQNTVEHILRNYSSDVVPDDPFSGVATRTEAPHIVMGRTNLRAENLDKFGTRMGERDVALGDPLVARMTPMTDTITRDAALHDAAAVIRQRIDQLTMSSADGAVMHEAAVPMAGRYFDIANLRHLNPADVGDEVHGPSYEVATPGHWSKLVHWGFDRFLGPKLDAIIRQPMFTEHFMRAWQQAEPYFFDKLADEPPEVLGQRGVGPFYLHGAARPIGNLTDDLTKSNPGNLYGPGLYSTQDPETAASYARSERWDPEDNPEPAVHRMVWRGPGQPKMLDLEQPLPNTVVNTWLKDKTFLRQVRQGLYRMHNASEAPEAFRDILTEIGPLKASDAQLRAALLTTLKDTRGVDAYDTLDQIHGFDLGTLGIKGTMNQALQDAGYDGMTHTGGIRTGGPEHPVSIWFNASKLGAERRIPMTIVGERPSPEAFLGAQQGLRAVALDRAVADTIPFIHDAQVRSQFDTYVRNISPFMFAQTQFWKRWARTLSHSPEAFEKASLLLNGIRHAGLTKTDPDTGQETFNYPGSGAFIRLLAHTPGVSSMLFGGPASIPTTEALTGEVKQSLPGLRNPVELSLSPMVGVPLTLAARQFPELANVHRTVMGPQASDSIFGQLFPSWAGKVVSAVMGNEDSQAQLASARLQVLAGLAAEGKMPGDPGTVRLDKDGNPVGTWTNSDLETFKERVNHGARAVLLARGMFGFAAPAAPVAVRQGDLHPEYSKLLANLGDPQLATQKFLALHPDASVRTMVDPDAWRADTVFGTKSSTLAPIRPADAALAVMEQHKSTLVDYKNGAPWLIPQSTNGDPAARQAYNESVAIGLRLRKSPDEWIRDYRIASAIDTYYAAHDQLDEALAGTKSPQARQAMRGQWNQWKTAFYAEHPTFGEWNDSSDREQERNQTRTELNTLLTKNLPGMTDTAQADSIRTMLDSWDRYQQWRVSMATDQSTLADHKRTNVQSAFDNWGESYVLSHPEVATFWRKVLKPDAGKTDTTL